MKILFIDDDAMMFRPNMLMWAEWAKLPGEWLFAETPGEGLDLLAQGGIGLVLMDGNLITTTGAEVVRKIRGQGDKTLICMFSSDEEQNRLGEAAGAESFVNKKAFMEEYGKRFSGGPFLEMDKLAALITLAALKA